MGLALIPPGANHSTRERRTLREIRRELVEYINERTGIDRKVILEVLLAEESFFVIQIEKALQEEKVGRDRS
ncbi:hypothetical protein [Thermococcus sp.]|uniref:hypothetical protein n=1 Tax=Thermococcus sp. TaxID=35749 RepID=UPI0025F7E38C|nr:hypothetical protein [Thermococcus sp.]